MSYFVYILKSLKSAKIKTYVGYTNNLKKRILMHNTGKGAKSTRGRKWKLVYKKIYFTKNEAMSKEYILKNDRKLRKKILSKI